MLPPVAAASLAALLFLSLLVATPAAPCESACDVCFCAGPGFGNLTLQCVPDLVNITAIPCNIQPNITVLSIVDASITALAAGPLQALSNLTMLYLSSNRITRVDATALANQSKLQKLVLSGNLIEALPSELFNACRRTLESFQLTDNLLTSVPATLLSGMGSLQQLLLGGNRLTTLPAAMLSQVPQLELLVLSGNPIINISAGFFNSVAKLQQLQLDHMALTQLPVGIFRKQQALIMLDLSSNMFYRIAPDLFTGLRDLQALLIAFANVTEVAPGTFSNLNTGARMFPRLYSLTMVGDLTVCNVTDETEPGLVTCECAPGFGGALDICINCTQTSCQFPKRMPEGNNRTVIIIVLVVLAVLVVAAMLFVAHKKRNFRPRPQPHPHAVFEFTNPLSRPGGWTASEADSSHGGSGNRTRSSSYQRPTFVGEPVYASGSSDGYYDVHSTAYSVASDNSSAGGYYQASDSIGPQYELGQDEQDDNVSAAYESIDPKYRTKRRREPRRLAAVADVSGAAAADGKSSDAYSTFKGSSPYSDLSTMRKSYMDPAELAAAAPEDPAYQQLAVHSPYMVARHDGAGRSGNDDDDGANSDGVYDDPGDHSYEVPVPVADGDDPAYELAPDLTQNK